MGVLPVLLSLHLVVSFIYNTSLCHPKPAKATEMQSSDLGKAAIFGWHFPVRLLLSRMTLRSLSNCTAFLGPKRMPTA